MSIRIVEDNISFRSDIAVRCVSQEVSSPQGTLVVVEYLSRFGNFTVSLEYSFRHATAAARERTSLKQLALIEKHKD